MNIAPRRSVNPESAGDLAHSTSRSKDKRPIQNALFIQNFNPRKSANKKLKLKTEHSTTMGSQVVLKEPTEEFKGVHN